MNQEKFNEALASFAEGCQRIHTDRMVQRYPNITPDVVSVRRGNRYAKVMRANDAGNSDSVHCFVDMTNGDVLKAASWKAPAKHARGNIFDEHNGLGSMGEYGPAYLR